MKDDQFMNASDPKIALFALLASISYLILTLFLVLISSAVQKYFLLERNNPPNLELYHFFT